MAERYNRSPIKASSYAVWTYKNGFNRNDKYKQARDLNADSEREKQNVLGSTVAENKNSEYADRLSDRVIAEVTDSLEDTLEDEEVRKNVWSDVDDELYIANLIKERTSNEVKREKRDTSGYLSDSDISEKVVSSVKLDYAMWEIEPTDLTECDCLGPPPEFLLPPPPRPPFLQAEYYCGDDPIPDLETCDTEPVSFLTVSYYKIFLFQILKDLLVGRQFNYIPRIFSLTNLPYLFYLHTLFHN